MPESTITVTDLGLVPVKGMRYTQPEAVELEPAGAAGDRMFLVVDADDALVKTTRTPKLQQVEPAWDPARGVLTLRFPDGSTVEDAIEPGAAAVTHNYEGRELRGRRVDGPLADALSEHLGRTVRLLQRDADVTAADDAPVTVMSIASLHALAPALTDGVPDPRRFRMTLTIDGVDAWGEEAWKGRELAVGGAVLKVDDPVPRCVVTTRDPDHGRLDVPILKALAQLRGKQRVDFGVWCDVVQPGTVRRGDGVELR